MPLSLSLRGKKKSLIFFSAINISVQRHGKRKKERTNEQVRNHCKYTNRGVPRKTGLPSSRSILVCIPPHSSPSFSASLHPSLPFFLDLQRLAKRSEWNMSNPHPKIEQNPIFFPLGETAELLVPSRNPPLWRHPNGWSLSPCVILNNCYLAGANVPIKQQVLFEALLRAFIMPGSIPTH